MTVGSIVFMTPPLSFEARYGSWAMAGNAMPSLGILSMAAVARQEGFTVRVIDAAARDLKNEEVLLSIRDSSPQYVGISATTVSIGAAAQFAEKLKMVNEDITIIVGGPHITAVPRETMKRFLHFDVGVMGEGEVTIVGLLKALESDVDLAAIKGIVYRKEKDVNGDVLLTPPREFIRDLNQLPLPAFDLLEGFPEAFHPPPFKMLRSPAASIVTSRGCPNQCSFCDRSVFGNHCRAFSSDYIITLIKDLIERYAIKELLIEDDTFVLFQSRLIEICETILREKLDLTWSCLGRVDMVKPELLHLMRKAGCWEIGYGIESGSQDILDLEGKKINLAQVEQAVAWTKEAGIVTKGFFMVGHPLETEETMSKTIDFAKKIPLDDISVMMLTPFPGSELYKQAHHYGVFKNEWEKMNLLQPVFIPKGLDEEILTCYTRKLLKAFYLRPHIIWSYFKRMLNYPGTVLSMIKGLYAFLISVFPVKK